MGLAKTVELAREGGGLAEGFTFLLGLGLVLRRRLGALGAGSADGVEASFWEEGELEVRICSEVGSGWPDEVSIREISRAKLDG